LQDEGVDVEHGQRTYYKVERFIAMNDPDPQPATLHFGRLRNAIDAARAHTASEPWRTHARVTVYHPGYTPGYMWFERRRVTGEVYVSEMAQAMPKNLTR
jgi:hypothetical protein